MQAVLISSERREEWNLLAAREPSFALLHSWEWGEFKQASGWSPFRIAIEEQGQIVAGAQMLVKPLVGHSAGVAYIPRGLVGCWVQPEIAPLLFAEIHRVARLCNSVFLKIEPPVLASEPFDQMVRCHGLRRSTYSNQPNSTIILDISPNPESILGQMRKKTRQYIRSASREGIEIRRGGRDDLPAFYELLQKTGQRERFRVHNRQYYETEWDIFDRNKQVVLLMAYQQRELLAVRTAYCFGNHAAEFHAGSVANLENKHPNYLLVWEAIKWAREQGCSSYDLWGIPDELAEPVEEEAPKPQRTDGLWGVYQFKRGFSKNVVSYVGAYDYVYKPFLYQLLTNNAINPHTLDGLAVLKDSLLNRRR